MTPWVYLSAAEDSPIDELDAEKYRQLVSFRERAQEDWKSWALKAAGEVIAMEGPVFKLRVPADALKEVADLHERHEATTTQTISIGIGTRLSDADDALKVAKLKGPNTVTLWGPEAQDLLARNLNKAEDKSPPQAQGPESPETPGPQPLEANSPSAGGGFMSPQSAGDEPTPDQKDPHEVLGALASQQGQKDAEGQAQQAQADAQDQATGDLKSQLLDVLGVFKERAQDLETLSQQDPELYKALTGMVQILVAMSRDYFSQDAQVQKAEDMDLLGIMGMIARGEASVKCPNCHGEPEGPHERGDHCPECNAINERGDFGSSSCKNCFNIYSHGPDVEKAGLEPNKTGRHEITLPVGSTKDPGPTGTHDAGKIKIQDPESGHSKWRSVRAGLVMAPDGTAVSSRNPGAR